MRSNLRIPGAVVVMILAGMAAVAAYLWLRPDDRARVAQQVHAQRDPEQTAGVLPNSNQNVRAPTLKNVPKPVVPKQRSSSDRQPSPLLQVLEGEQHEAAEILLELSADDLLRMLEETGLGDIPAVTDLVPALKNLQTALRGTDLAKAMDAAREFMRLMSFLDTDEAHDLYLERRFRPGFSTAYKSLLVPAAEETERFLSSEVTLSPESHRQ